MGQRMKLIDVIKTLDSFDEDKTIYAKEPWTLNSETIVDFEPDNGGVPNSATNMEYFLEVFLALEFLEGLNSHEFNSWEKKCLRLIQYAINDA